MKLVDGTLDARANLAAVVRPERNPDHFEARAVVPFEQTGDQVCDGMLVKIAREICESDAIGLTDPSCRQWLALADFGPHKSRCGLCQRGIADWQREQD